MDYSKPFLFVISTLISITLLLSIHSCDYTEDSSSSTTNNDISLPSINYFNTNPSDQFLVSMNHVVDGHMYRGENALDPHPGAHVYFSNADSSWPLTGTDIPDNYPPIYAIADGYVNSIDTYYSVADNYRYGITLRIAKDNETTFLFHYSIEPFINPQDTSFYEPYIFVKQGDSVKKGDIIASMYLAPGSGSNAHIHFNLLASTNGPSMFLAPIIFTDNLISEFTEKISTENGGYRNFDYNKNLGHPWMGDCLGYKLAGSENPFGTNDEDCAK